ncbi:MAG: hypothetical protein HZA77_07325 [Candidatus Schekmanbacteria bacterium]|nr:hypothetical protein [Candidatus Schekmanbacteria bacterium]
MKIAKIEPARIDNFLDFNKKSFPERKNTSERFKYQFIENPLLQDKEHPHGYLCYNDNDEIAGQFMASPFEFHLSGRDYKGYFGCDYYVSENSRGISGAVLACKAIRSYRPYFAIGLTETAKKIHLSLGTKVLGNLRKFIWVRNLINPLLITAKLYSKEGAKEGYYKNRRSPEKISSYGEEFVLADNSDGWNNYHWTDTLEFSRSPEFLKWRFFGTLKGYYFYLSKKSKNQSYFVVRKSMWRGMQFLLLLDYKVPYQDEKAFLAILKASKLLAKELGCDGVITFSSHMFFDQGLKKSFFFKIGNQNLILTNADIDSRESSINKREFVYATIADSDIDFDFDEGLCEYGFK